MVDPRRRAVLRAAGAAAAAAALPPSIARALAIPAAVRSGTLDDVDHIVVLTQENRAFDHYFGTMPGVRGFADPFPIPVPDAPGIRGKTVWWQPNHDAGAAPAAIAPFRLDTEQQFDVMRVAGTPHTWADAQHAWNEGRLDRWPRHKANHAMGHYAEADLPFQWALANAFTLCDAYHCAVQAGTNPNRLFLFTGTNDPLARGNGPATSNDYEWFDGNPGNDGGYRWTTYPERLQAAGVRWQVYEDMADQFTDNPLAGFQVFRDAWFQRPGHAQQLRERGVGTRDLALLKADVLAGTLPSVAWIVATAAGSEHPGPSSPAQGADYTARVLDALTADPAVWARTVLIVNFDENDGFFDHVPPPAPPSRTAGGGLAGGSTVDTTGEYHEVLLPYRSDPAEQALLHRPYGLGPRVPCYVVSPWSRGGWVTSQVFDHTSVIRLIERRFGVTEPNISAWRRAVCGDLTDAFDFAAPNDSGFVASLPATVALAERARALPAKTTPLPPPVPALPRQAAGVRPSRALPYRLEVACSVEPGDGAGDGSVTLRFANTGTQAAVFHVYDRRRLQDVPRRYTVGAAQQWADRWRADSGSYDLWVLGPNGFHRHVTGRVAHHAPGAAVQPEVLAAADAASGDLLLRLVNTGRAPAVFVLTAHRDRTARRQLTVAAQAEQAVRLPLAASGQWYDHGVAVRGLPGFGRRFAGRVETGRPSVSDPAMAGVAVGDQLRVDLPRG